jgi:hypothetical protein
MKNGFLANENWSSLSSEPSKSGSSSIHFALTNSPQTSSGCLLFFEFPDFFSRPTIKTNEKTQKLSSKHVSGGKRARRAGIFLEKIKISAISGNWLALAWNFLQFPGFFG